jgi:hypothetical protein
MTRDIRPLGAADGKASYWIKDPQGYPFPSHTGTLRLVVIDELGAVHPTPVSTDWDDSAPTRAEAIAAHLAGLVKDADRDRERRKRVAPPPEPKPPPMDPATRRFLHSEDYPAVDLTVPDRWW